MKGVQKEHGQADAGAANEVKEQETAGPAAVPGRIFGRRAERPQLVPQKIVGQGGLGSDDFANRHPPAQAAGVGQ